MAIKEVKEQKILSDENGIEYLSPLIKRRKVFVPDEILDASAIKKNEIISTVLSEGAQLTLLGVLVEQIGDLVGLDTPEFTYAKAEFARINAILDGVE